MHAIDLSALAPVAVSRPARRLLVGAVVALAAAFALIMAYLLFVAFPALTETGDANLQVWIGPVGARIGYALLGALIAAAIVWVTLRGTRTPPGTASASWRIGLAVGATAGLLAVATAVAADLTAHTAADLDRTSLLGLLVALAAPLVAGFLASGVARRAGRAALAGFWCGLIYALVVATGGALTDLLLAGRLVRTAWVGMTFGAASGCNGAAGAALAACVIGDDLGGWVILILLLPLLGAGLAALAGLPASLLPGRDQVALPSPASMDAHSPAPAATGRDWAVAAPVVFSAFTLTLFVVEVALKLW